jgi:dolichol-phosphate mannosyltransferase
MAQVSVVIPTLNEVDNVALVVQGLLGLGLDLEVKVLDDGSSDGTLAVLDELAGGEPRLEVVRRGGRRGYGRAVLDGIERARRGGADWVLQMDGDRSHDPVHLRELLAAAQGAELVLGSRYAEGISVVRWPLRRLLLSIGAHAYVRALTGLGVRDCTTGYRLWRRSLLERIDLGGIRAEGYAFLVETLYRAAEAGATIVEVPILFVERKAGESKLTARVIAESVLVPCRLRRRIGLGPRRAREREGGR